MNSQWNDGNDTPYPPPYIRPFDQGSAILSHDPLQSTQYTAGALPLNPNRDDGRPRSRYGAIQLRPHRALLAHQDQHNRPWSGNTAIGSAQQAGPTHREWQAEELRVQEALRARPGQVVLSRRIEYDRFIRRQLLGNLGIDQTHSRLQTRADPPPSDYDFPHPPTFNDAPPFLQDNDVSPMLLSPPSDHKPPTPAQILYPSRPPSVSPVANPILRSWTLDSPSRSSLAPMEPTHSRRHLTRSPSFIPDGQNAEAPPHRDHSKRQPDRVGGPPKAKLGGPNGKTYEELRAGDPRVVSAPASTPPPRPPRVLSLENIRREDSEEGTSGVEDTQWGSNFIAVRLPGQSLHTQSTSIHEWQSAIQTAESDDNALLLNSVSSTSLIATDRKSVRQQSTPKGASDQGDKDSRATDGELDSAPASVKKEVIVSVPICDQRGMPIHRQSRLLSNRNSPEQRAQLQINNKRGRYSDNSDDTPPHQLKRSTPSSETSSLKATAEPFMPLPTTNTESALAHQDRLDKLAILGRRDPVLKLRPVAPPFEPVQFGGRFVTTPEPGMSEHAIERDKARSAVRSLSIDFGRGDSAKRLRPSAPTFQPGKRSTSSSTTSLNPHSQPWLPTKSAAEPVSCINTFKPPEADTDAQTAIDKTNEAESAFATLPTIFGIQVGTVSSPSPSSAAKRLANGVGLPLAVPFTDFSFRSVDVPPPPNRFWISCPAADVPSQSVGTTETQKAEETVFAEIPEDSSEEIGSPASRLHNLGQMEGHEESFEVDDEEDALDGIIREDGGGSTLDRQQNPRGNFQSRTPSPSLQSGSSARSDSGQSIFDNSDAVISPGIAHLPFESFGLPSPFRPEDDSDIFGSGPHESFGTSSGFDDSALYHTPLENLPTPSTSTFGDLPASDPRTPTGSRNHSHQHSAEGIYDKADGSALLHRQYLETPATPKKSTSIGSRISHYPSPTPARSRSRPPMLANNATPLSGTSKDGRSIHDKSTSSAAEPIHPGPEDDLQKQSKDFKFRNWIFPESPTVIKKPINRPSVTRRFTFPVPKTEQASLAGIASTARGIQPYSGIIPAGIDGPIIPELSTRTSVEFPLRPERRTLAVTNDVPVSEIRGGGLDNARPGISQVSSETRVTDTDHVGELRMQGLLERIEESLKDLKAEKQQIVPKPEMEGSDEGFSVAKIRDELKGMIADLRKGLEDRLELIVIPPIPTAPDYRKELDSQYQLLVELLDQKKAATPATTSTTETNNVMTESLALLTVGQSTLLDMAKANSDSQIEYAKKAQIVIGVLQAARKDDNTKKKDDERKDEMIKSLQDQLEARRLAEVAVSKLRENAEERSRDLEFRLRSLEVEKESVKHQLKEAEERGDKANKRADELEAAQLAIVAEREQLASVLTESFARRTEAEAEAEKLRKELETEKNTNVQRADQFRISEDLTANNKNFQDKLLEQVKSLSQSALESARDKDTARDELKEEKRVLQNEVTILRRQTFESASKIAEAELRLASSANAASILEVDLRRSLDQVEKSKIAAESKVAELEAGMERLRAEKLNLGMVATERSGAMRLLEVRYQALVQENVFWREFALSYDRREHRKYVQSNPFRTGQSNQNQQSDPVVPVETKLETRRSSSPSTPKGAVAEGKEDVEKTPDLSMSASSSSAEGIIQLTQTPKGEESGDGNWWGVAN